MSRSRPKISNIGPKSVKGSAVKAAGKPKTAGRTLKGIPLKRKTIWVYDTESPKFKAIWKMERAALRNAAADPDLEEFLDDALGDIDRSLDR